MARRVTINRKRIQPRRLALDPEGYVYVQGLRVARYLPESGVLQFGTRRADRNQGEQRMVEVTLSELIAGLNGDQKLASEG